MFAYAAIVQLNDPDPVPWIVMYGTAATCCGLAVAGRLPHRPAIGFGLLTSVLAAALYLSAGDDPRDMAGQHATGLLDREVIRETLGLLVASIWTVILGAWTLRRRPPDP